MYFCASFLSICIVLQDDPKTLGVTLYCPIPMNQKKLCVSLSKGITSGELKVSGSSGHSFLVPFTMRSLESRYHLPKQQQRYNKQKQAHAVCTVQIFRNPMSGPMLALFVEYYLRMGYVVIVYDRGGKHREFVAAYLSSLKFVYRPYTAFNLLFPEQYNYRERNIQVK